MPLQALLHVLLEQKELHHQLLGTAAEKKQAIIDNNVDLLNRLTNKEAKLTKQVVDMEEKRVFEMNRFIVGKGYRPNPSITLSDMIKLVFKAEDKLQLQSIQTDLLQVINRLKEVNQVNQQLIEHSLQFVNYSLDLLSGPPDDDAVYRHPGHQQSINRGPGMFDTRA